MAKKRRIPWADGADTDIVARFKGKRDYSIVHFDGDQWHFFVSGFGLEAAEEALGEDVYARLYAYFSDASKAAQLVQNRVLMADLERLNGRLEGLSEDDDVFFTVTAERDAVQGAVLEMMAEAMAAAGFTRNMKTYAGLFFAGVAMFYPALTFREVLMRLTRETQKELEPVVARELGRIQTDRVQTEKALKNGTDTETAPNA